ncbi:MAG: cytochrome c biogenesis protein ResB [Syntrophales bacterium]
MKSKNAGTFWSFITSVRLTVILLIAMAALSVIGTFIPQQGEMIDTRLHPGTLPAAVLDKLRVSDLYHSVYFMILMSLILLNLAACTWRRFPSLWKRFKTVPDMEKAETHDFAAAGSVFYGTRGPGEEAGRLEAAMRSSCTKVVRHGKTEHVSILYGERNSFSIFSVPLIHFSVLVIICGAITGSMAGFEGYVTIPEGEAAQSIITKGNRHLKKLDFAVRCDRFSMDFYENGAPREFRSDLSFIKNGRVAYQGPLLVNHPITFEGIRFYQAGYGLNPSGSLIKVKRGKKIWSIQAGTGESFDLPESDVKVTILRIEDDLMGLGPAVKLNIQLPDRNLQFWVLKHIEKIGKEKPMILEMPIFDPGSFRPYSFSLLDIRHGYFTGLQVNRDPGVAVVAAGSIMMVCGFILAYFFAPVQIWIRVDNDSGRAKIRMMAKTRWNKASGEREIRRILREYDCRKG